MGEHKGLISIIVIAIAAIVVFVLGYNLYQEEQERLASIPPSAPAEFKATKVSANQIELSWKDTSKNALGFRIFRDGQKLTELSKDVSIFTDYEVEPSTVYKYEVTAFNDAGISDRVILVIKTPNPPIMVRLDMVGVIDNGEDPLRELLDKHGEIFIGVVIKDGKKTIARRLPTEGYYKLADNEVREVGSLIFTTEAVGDYLNINIIGFEDDGGIGDELLARALNMAFTSSMGNLGSVILSLAGVDFTDTFRDIIGFKDDYLGEYYEEWHQSNNWGEGSYKDIRCDKGDGIGLRLWFTIIEVE